MAAPSLSKFEKFTKKYRIFDLPFVFEDIDAVDRFQNSETGQALKDSMARRGLQGLAFWHNGMKQMSANRPLVKPEDASGLKFRVQASDVLVAQFEQLGANPQKMSFKEVYGGLQTKVIDGQENTWSNIYGKKFFEVQDGVTETNHGIIDYLVVTSTEWWDGLDAGIKDQLSQILKEVTEERNKESFVVNEANKEKVIAAGSPVRTEARVGHVRRRHRRRHNRSCSSLERRLIFNSEASSRVCAISFEGPRIPLGNATNTTDREAS
jgi:C4-dicarboxylate-binding protein DctP